MTIQQLEYFLEAARTLNFTKAAETFFISQSAMTQQMKNLEEELQVTLFARNNRKISLTEAGALFVTEARSLVTHTKEAIDRVQAVQNGFSGTLTIGYMGSVEMQEFSKILQTFHLKYPAVRLNLKKDTDEHLYEDYQIGKYDVIFNVARNDFFYHHTKEVPLREFGFTVALPANHRLAGRKLITQEDLLTENLIMRDITIRPGGRTSLTYGEMLDAALYDNIVSKETDVETALILVISGMGVAIMPDFDVMQNKMNLNLAYVPLDTHGYQVKVNLYYDQQNTNPLLALFLDECRAYKP